MIPQTNLPNAARIVKCLLGYYLRFRFALINIDNGLGLHPSQGIGMAIIGTPLSKELTTKRCPCRLVSLFLEYASSKELKHEILEGSHGFDQLLLKERIASRLLTRW
jgi:hypothetical protein